MRQVARLHSAIAERLHFARAFHSRPFTLLWAGQTISVLGDAVFTIAITWEVLLLSKESGHKAFSGESSVSIVLTSCRALATSPAKIKPMGFFAMRQIILVPSCFKTSSLAVMPALTLWGSTFSGKGCLSIVQIPAEMAAFML